LVLAGGMVLCFGALSFLMGKSHRWAEDTARAKQGLDRWLRGNTEHTAASWQYFGRKSFKVCIVLGPSLIVVGLVWLIFSLPMG
jgi:hypothetical protein